MANEFINDVVGKTKMAAEYAGKKVGAVVDITKLNLKLIETKNALEKVFTEIGKTTYAASKDGADKSEELAALFEKADGLKEKAASLKKEIAAQKGRAVCPDCGSANPEGSSYCNNCGKDLKNI
ncbi:MAG: zinc ribbon domain-containing protein [Clostridia bacterium]|nr:zinc ribbon domain-containing protein [Clostridia bacterium]